MTLKRSRDVFQVTTSDEQIKNSLVLRFQDIHRKMDQLDKMASDKLASIESKATRLSTTLKSNPYLAFASPNLGGFLTQPLVPSRLRSDPIKTLWFTKRPYPAFSVFLEDERGQQVTAVTDWQLRIRVKSGFGEYVESQVFLGGKALEFPFVNGQAAVTGLKFLAVTSKKGGYFKLEFTAVPPRKLTPAPRVKPLLSSRIRVLSERLYSEIKAEDVTQMKPDEKIIHIPGIGRKYSNRFAELGIANVADLASMDESQESLAQLLAAVKKERGTLTEDKLLDIVQECKVAVTRAAEQAEQDSKEEEEDEEEDEEEESLSSTSVTEHCSDSDIPSPAPVSPVSPDSNTQQQLIYTSPLFSSAPVVPLPGHSLDATSPIDPAALMLDPYMGATAWPSHGDTPDSLPADTPLLMDVEKPEEWYMVFGGFHGSEPAAKRRKTVWQGEQPSETSVSDVTDVDGFINHVSISST